MSQSHGHGPKHLGMETWLRQLTKVQTELTYCKWLWTWPGCWCVRHLSEYFTVDLLRLHNFTAYEKKKYRLRSSGNKNVLLKSRYQRNISKLLWADRKPTITQITDHNNHSMQKSIFEHIISLTEMLLCQRYCSIPSEKDGIEQHKTAPGTPTIS